MAGVAISKNVADFPLYLQWSNRLKVHVYGPMRLILMKNLPPVGFFTSNFEGMYVWKSLFLKRLFGYNEPIYNDKSTIFCPHEKILLFLATLIPCFYKFGHIYAPI